MWNETSSSPEISHSRRTLSVMTGVIGPEHRSKRIRARLCLRDALLVEIVAENVDAVRAGQVVGDVCVDIGDGDAGRGLHEGAGRKMLAHKPAVLKRDPVGFNELQIGDAAGSFRRHLPSLGIPLFVEAGEVEEGALALLGDRGRRAIGTEEILGAEFVERDQPCDPLRHLRMPGQRAVLGPRQGQSGPQFGKNGRGASNRGGGQGQNRKRRIHVDKR